MALLVPVIVLSEDEEHPLTSGPVTPVEREAMLDVLAGSVLLIYRYCRDEVKPRRTPKKRSRSKKA
jgi:hypothetical protein